MDILAGIYHAPGTVRRVSVLARQCDWRGGAYPALILGELVKLHKSQNQHV